MYPNTRFFKPILIWTSLLFLFPFTLELQAQYFGQNKVRYENFKFKVIKTAHFDVYFYPKEKEAAEEAARMAERWYTRFAGILKHELSGRQPLILYASHSQFEETNTTEGILGEGTGGFTEPLKRRIVLPLTGSLAETDHVIGHELVHAFQYDITGQGGGGFSNSSMLRLPLWFIEGMAEFLSLGPDDPNTAMWMRDAILSKKKFPTVKQLANTKYFPYRYGQALLAYISGRWGDEAIGDLLRATKEKGDIYQAIHEVLHVGADTLSTDWRNSLAETYKPLKTEVDTVASNATLLISHKNGAGDLNIAPAISPDGKRLVFFSEKSLFAIDLYLADAGTGKIIRKITDFELDPHYESLEFINSAGTWGPDGKEIAFSTIVNGQPVLTIMNSETGQIVKETRFSKLDEILNPSWSSDGNYIAFSALANGQSDLFIYDFQKDSLRQITKDLYSDLQPAWSPNNKSIAFVTDRFTTDLSSLNEGQYELAIYDLKSGRIDRVATFNDGKSINPQWSLDGKSIYFLSDCSGIANLYKVNLDNQQLYRLSDLYTGISGITALSPAFSVAQNTNRITFCAYKNEKYNIYSIDSTQSLAGERISKTNPDSLISAQSINPAVLPPAERKSNKLINALSDVNDGLPSDTNYAAKPYHAKFSLDDVSQSFLYAGGSQYGLQLGGGVSLYWSDLLGNQNLVTALQLDSERGFANIGGGVGYINRASRWNWGLLAQQVPYVYRSYAEGYGTLNNNAVYVELEDRYRQINRDLSVLATYPFSRASRIEVSGGYEQVSFSHQLVRTLYDAYSGSQINEKTESLPVPGTLNLATTNIAYVYDYSVFGATSPVIGQRYRFEISPTAGSLSLYTLLLDYRRYFQPISPFTIAFRALHYGRYGRDAEDDRLLPLFIGYPEFVRGYSSNSFSANEASVFDQLLGSRIAVANLEARFPLFGSLGIGRGYYGILPIEAGIFYDAGMTWTNHDKPDFLGGNRELVKSYGLTGRINLLGFAVLEIDYVNPVDRPGKGWFWQFNLNTGF
jgi:Tol biopolymer transport system component